MANGAAAASSSSHWTGILLLACASALLAVSSNLEGTTMAIVGIVAVANILIGASTLRRGNELQKAEKAAA